MRWHLCQELPVKRLRLRPRPSVPSSRLCLIVVPVFFSHFARAAPLWAAALLRGSCTPGAALAWLSKPGARARPWATPVSVEEGASSHSLTYTQTEKPLACGLACHSSRKTGGDYNVWDWYRKGAKEASEDGTMMHSWSDYEA